MDERALFTGFWTKESQTTAKVIGRIPEGSDYRPDPKSRPAQEIAWQVVVEELMLIEALETGVMQLPERPMPKTMKEICETYGQQSADIARRLAALPEEKWGGQMEFFGQQLRAAGMAWSFLFDIVHHRGQLTTYLRAMGSTVPQIYGPSADEP